MPHGVGRLRTPRGLAATWLAHRGSHGNVLVCGGQMGKKGRLNGLSILKGDGTGDVNAERSSLS